MIRQFIILLLFLPLSTIARADIPLSSETNPDTASPEALEQACYQGAHSNTSDGFCRCASMKIYHSATITGQTRSRLMEHFTTDVNIATILSPELPDTPEADELRAIFSSCRMQTLNFAGAGPDECGESIEREKTFLLHLPNHCDNENQCPTDYVGGVCQTPITWSMHAIIDFPYVRQTIEQIEKRKKEACAQQWSHQPACSPFPLVGGCYRHACTLVDINTHLPPEKTEGQQL